MPMQIRTRRSGETTKRSFPYSSRDYSGPPGSAFRHMHCINWRAGYPFNRSGDTSRITVF